MSEDCIFCKIISGDIPGKKVFEDDRLIVIEDIDPQAPHHLLIFVNARVVNSTGRFVQYN